MVVWLSRGQINPRQTIAYV